MTLRESYMRRRQEQANRVSEISDPLLRRSAERILDLSPHKQSCECPDCNDMQGD